ncbi:MAG: hypothetical protein K2X03_02505 [Bryobacteraceae bacterium]|nr:hypothetical protein [Bryobacteraceae bacterium]
MAEQKLTTAEDVLAAVRQHGRICDEVEISDAETAAKVLTAFDAKMKQRSDLGVTNRLLNLFLDPRNPFEPQKTRRPKMETVIFGTLLLLVLAAVLFFNLSAPRVYP